MADGDRETGSAASPEQGGERREEAHEAEAPSPSLRELLAKGSYPIGGATEAPEEPEEPAERRPRDSGPRVEYFGDGMMSPGLSRNPFVLKEYHGPEPVEDASDLGPEYTIRHHLPEILTIVGAILFVIIATL